MDDYRMNPAEVGMTGTGKSTGAFKVIEDKDGMPIGGTPIGESAPLGSDAEYLREIEAEQKAEEIMKAQEESNINKIIQNGGTEKELDEVDINTVLPQVKNMPVVDNPIVDKEVVEVVEKPIKPLTEEEINAKYLEDMEKLNKTIALLKKNSGESTKNVQPVATKVDKVKPKTEVIATNKIENTSKVLELEATITKLSDALVEYRNKVTIAELKSNYKIQLLIEEIMSNTDEETGGKILSKYYKYVSANKTTDNMLAIK